MADFRHIGGFPRRLKHCRKLLCKLNQFELAHLAGLSQSAVAALEAGSVAPTVGELERLADALHVSTAYLLCQTIRRRRSK